MAQLDMPAEVYNWLFNFFSSHMHCTCYPGEVSSMSAITAGIIQGSSIGPASYVVSTGDLHAVRAGNQMVKFADDTYMIIPAANVGSQQAELDNVELLTRANNLKVNHS